MNVNIYAIKDAKLNAFAQPFFSQTHGSAIRAFADHVNEKGTAANKHPEDFTLHHIGKYDDQTGDIIGDDVRQLAAATEYLNKE